MSLVKKGGDVEELSEILRKNKLSDQQVALWKKVFKLTDDKGTTAILDAFLNEPGAVRFLTENLEKKIAAIKNGGTEALEKVIEEEVKELSQ